MGQENFKKLVSIDLKGNLKQIGSKALVWKQIFKERQYILGILRSMKRMDMVRSLFSAQKLSD